MSYSYNRTIENLNKHEKSAFEYLNRVINEEAAIINKLYNETVKILKDLESVPEVEHQYSTAVSFF